MVEAVNVSAMVGGYTPPVGEENAGAPAPSLRPLPVVATADGDRVTLSSSPGRGAAMGYDARGHLGSAGSASATVPENDVVPPAGGSNTPGQSTVEYRTSLSSLFAVQPNGPSALPVRTGTTYIGTPPLAKAIDLLRSMMIAFSQAPSTETATSRRVPVPPAGGGVAPPPSNVAQA